VVTGGSPNIPELGDVPGGAVPHDAGMEPTALIDDASGRDGARRRRPLLVTLSTLGVVAGLLGVAGVYALGSDRATTGANDAISGDVPAPPTAVDLQLATATLVADGQYACNDDWVEDLTTGLILSGGLDLSQQHPGTPGGGGEEPPTPPILTPIDEGVVCIRNVGAQGAAVSVTALDMVDTELGCSAGELEADTTCGSGVGELSSDLVTGVLVADEFRDCATAGPTPALAVLDGASLPVTFLEAGEAAVVCPAVRWLEAPASQSDQVSWRYAFDGVESSEPTGPTSCPDDDGFEPNDDLSDAASNGHDGLGVNHPIVAVSCADGNADWFRVLDYSDDYRTFAVEWDEPDTDLDLVLYDEAGDLVTAASSTDEGIERVAEIPRDVFYVEVVHYEGPTTPYTLTLTPIVP
jgi:hypothetical protein